MACKSLIYATTTNTTSAVANSTLPLTTIIRKRGRDIDLCGSAVTINDDGSNYYLVNVSATFTAPTEGLVTLALQQNGATVTGAAATTTISTAATEVKSLSFSAIVRTFNSCSTDILSILNAGVAASFSNISLSVIKL